MITITFDVSFLGPPAGFCKGKSDGNYANPERPSEFFYCRSGLGSQCQACGFGVYFAECGLCLAPGSSKFLSPLK